LRSSGGNSDKLVMPGICIVHSLPWLGFFRPAVGMMVGVSGKAGWWIAPPTGALEIGVKLQAETVRSTITALKHCGALKMSNASSRISFNGCVSRRIAPNWISS